jgi:enoyl-CoA hydratase/carnithine racemase
MSDLVLRSDADGVATLTINRAEKRNALNIDVFAALAGHIDALETQTETIGVVVVRGAGVAFSAGADLGKQQKPPFAFYQAKTLERLAALPQPVIAAVHGVCFAGGLELALAADLIFASEGASFADLHGRWGLVPGWGLSQRLPRRIGTHRARMMSFTGRRIDGRTAERIGLAEFCVPDADFDKELSALAAEVAGQSWHSLRGYKRLYVDSQDLPLAEGLGHEIYRSPGRAPDVAERIGSRFDKR